MLKNTFANVIGFGIGLAVTATGVTANQSDVESLNKKIEAIEDRIPLHFGPGVEMLYLYSDSSEQSRDKMGTFFLSKFELIINGDLGEGIYFDSRVDYQVTIQEAFPAWMYFGYDLSEHTTMKFGVVNQPLGAGVDGGYYDFSFMSDAPLWLGLAHNPDMGIKVVHEKGDLTLVGSFMKNPESKGGDPNGRFRPDLISQGLIVPKNGNNSTDTYDASIETTNTLSLGVAYDFNSSDNSSFQLGVNGQFGQLYNTRLSESFGDHWAVAAFMNYQSGPVIFRLQALPWDYKLDQAPVAGDITTLDSIALSTGALIPASGEVYSTRLSYTTSADIGPYSEMQFYHDYDFVSSGSDDAYTSDDSQFSIVGVRLGAGSFNTWISILSGKNANFANGGPDDDTWNTQFNLVLGLYM